MCGWQRFIFQIVRCDMRTLISILFIVSASFASLATAQDMSAKFRVVLNGFTVNSETWDHILEPDGKGDEVYLLAEVRCLNAAGVITQSSSPRSKIFGDINGQNGRIQAGSRSD